MQIAIYKFTSNKRCRIEAQVHAIVIAFYFPPFITNSMWRPNKILRLKKFAALAPLRNLIEEAIKIQRSFSNKVKKTLHTSNTRSKCILRFHKVLCFIRTVISGHYVRDSQRKHFKTKYSLLKKLSIPFTDFIKSKTFVESLRYNLSLTCKPKIKTMKRMRKWTIKRTNKLWKPSGGSIVIVS